MYSYIPISHFAFLRTLTHTHINIHCTLNICTKDFELIDPCFLCSNFPCFFNSFFLLSFFSLTVFFFYHQLQLHERDHEHVMMFSCFLTFFITVCVCKFMIMLILIIIIKTMPNRRRLITNK